MRSVRAVTQQYKVADLHLPDRLVLDGQCISQQRPSVLDWLSVKQCFGFSSGQDLQSGAKVHIASMARRYANARTRTQTLTSDGMSPKGKMTFAAAASPSKQLRTLAAAIS